MAIFAGSTRQSWNRGRSGGPAGTASRARDLTGSREQARLRLACSASFWFEGPVQGAIGPGRDAAILQSVVSRLRPSLMHMSTEGRISLCNCCNTAQIVKYMHHHT